ncbi:uncharacterized protein NECHADRAFT_80930 [Fusarium vanettenii 77-13-4]|uniref:NmrA-like domain-containing protein n=1 Tax=Fusarium vanettenii (strain ATCC MYA-4622 / CBS 123669 / FGSC 9596 / NRRL 45880 / 77-13-4) TaxID=660122 RepID=C7YT28_FUSV7|nr:uncharacterized protein NECHADRAFT_80930 [Fusarium vanettenii 77-13-4]EEU45339.1 hypothetical protein NECHADRAFT_80930 [Fusarium vanettenii 77-13-4]
MTSLLNTSCITYAIVWLSPHIVIGGVKTLVRVLPDHDPHRCVEMALGERCFWILGNEDINRGAKAIAASYMSPLAVVIDMENNVAAIPGSGDTPAVFTHSLDIGRYVDAALDLERWDPFYRIVGDKITWNRFVAAAQDAKGTPFRIIHDSVEDLKKGEATVLPSVDKYLHLMSVPSKTVLSQFLATFGRLFDDGSFNIEEKGALNSMFSDIKPLTIQHAVEASVQSDSMY